MRMAKATETAFLIAALIVFAPSPGATQPATATTNAQGEDPPIEIEAEEGIEWHREANLVHARGNARAVRGSLEVTADTLTAFYRDRADGTGSEVWRLDATGNVRIASAGETAFAGQGTYDLGTGVLVLTEGSPLRLVTEQSTITADDRMEYRTKTRTLVAEGNAKAVEPDRQIEAQVLTAFLTRDSGGKSRLDRLEAVKNVRVVTPDEVVRGDKGIYEPGRGLATITGAVKITRGGNQLNGCRGEVNMRTGVSKLFACPGAESGGGRSRVHGLILPGTVDRD
jgi:lipopolysaccharide export system protein LptA